MTDDIYTMRELVPLGDFYTMTMRELVSLGGSLLDEIRAARSLPMADAARAPRLLAAEQQFRKVIAEANKRAEATARAAQ